MNQNRREFLAVTGSVAVGAFLTPTLRAETERSMTPQETKPAPNHVLPALPYAPDALEPFYDQKTVELHHDIHHKGYVDGLNKAEADLAEALKSGDFSKTKTIAKAMAFHGSGHVLHSIFWTNMKPKGGGDPEGELAKKIEMDFGSVKNLKSLITQAANTAEGSGWGILGYRKSDDRLIVLQIEKHENFIQWGVDPLLALDVWEHAYYLKYMNKRASWTETFMANLVNWQDVGERLKAARG